MKGEPRILIAGDLESRHVVVPMRGTGPPRLTPFPGQEKKEDDRHAYHR